MKQTRTTWPARFAHAADGIVVLLRTQKSARVHAAATACVCAAALALGFDRHEWCLLVLCIALVWAAEAFNTALEFLADAACPQRHPLVKNAKDAAAAAVLIAAAGSVVAGLLLASA